MKSHYQYSIEKLGTDKYGCKCSAHHITFGGKCLNCGYDPEAEKTAWVDVDKRKAGCNKCLWASAECNRGSMYNPQETTDGSPSCRAYTYYD